MTMETIKTLGMGTALAVLGALILMFSVPGAAATKIQADSIEGLKRLYEKENAAIFWPYLCSALSAAPDYKGPAAKRYRSDCLEDFGHKGPALPIEVK